MGQKGTISRRKPQGNLAIDEDFRRRKWPLLAKKTTFSIFQTSPSTKGIYRFSRNPMYVAYDLIFLGCATLAKSWLLLGLTACFILSGHWIIRAEERWCAARFGEEYQAYRKRVRKYF
ncbi:methyltransferase family protein [Acutalibacter intestini]|uniref:methyltransferase family protein n=1 Tax=Acutalibacter intestini TaxID=3093659 RepID=UPI002AC9DF23|nr:isoprenylcysteine carboxylmethyltransferase family protein [Acutalibacter sp. M00204]